MADRLFLSAFAAFAVIRVHLFFKDGFEIVRSIDFELELVEILFPSNIVLGDIFINNLKVPLIIGFLFLSNSLLLLILLEFIIDFLLLGLEIIVLLSDQVFVADHILEFPFLF